MIILKTAEELDRMRASGRIAATVRDALSKRMVPGMTTLDVDHMARDLIQEAGARSAFLGYRGFPGHICISLNDEVVHGIPGQRRIEIGDLVSIDIGVVYEGFVGDTATTVMVAVHDAELIRLVRSAERALSEGIAHAVCGGFLSDISHAIQRVVEADGYSIVRDFVGHGVGRSLHEDPQIPNYGPPGKGPRLRAGMTLAIEPMVNLGRPEVDVQRDGWTVLTRDRKPSVHVEHTIALLESGPEILTCSPKMN